MRYSANPIRRAMIGLVAAVAAGVGIMAIPVATAQAGPLPGPGLPTISLPPNFTLPPGPGITIRPSLPPLQCQGERSWSESYEGGTLYTNVPMRRYLTVLDDPWWELYCLHLTVSITHPQRSELRVELIEPNGVVHTLHTPGASSGTDYNRLHIIRGITSAGTFTLRVTDTVAGNTGRLNHWRIEANYR